MTLTTGEVPGAPIPPIRPGRNHPRVREGFGVVSEAARRERHAAFELHIMPHLEVLYRVALTLTGQPADAEDLVQDTLVRAYRALDRFDGAYPRAWLLTILRNTHVNRNRRRRPMLLPDGETATATLEVKAPAVPSSEELVIGKQFQAVVLDALRALPQTHRAVLALVDIDGLSYQEAADVLGIPRGTVMSRLHRARRRVRARLDAAGLVAHLRRT